METITAKAYFASNTGYRFISRKDHSTSPCFTVTIPKPEGGRFYASIGRKRLGDKAALRKAIKIRNKNGKQIWGKHWDRVRKEFTLLSRLPKNLEPRLWTDPDTLTDYYVARYTRYPSPYSDQRTEHSLKASVQKHGRLGAFSQVKRKLLAVYADNLELLSYMNRNLGTMLK